MTVNLTLAALAGVLVGCGVVLLVSRSLVRALLGVLLMSNGVNVAFLVVSGDPGRAPLVTKETADTAVIGAGGISDPLPQAMVLTAIVITLAVTAFALALAHRSWQVSTSDIVTDDTEDTRIGDLAAKNDLADSDYGDLEDPYALSDELDPEGGR